MLLHSPCVNKCTTNKCTNCSICKAVSMKNSQEEPHYEDTKTFSMPRALFFFFLICVSNLQTRSTSIFHQFIATNLVRTHHNVLPFLSQSRTEFTTILTQHSHLRQMGSLIFLTLSVFMNKNHVIFIFYFIYFLIRAPSKVSLGHSSKLQD